MQLLFLIFKPTNQFDALENPLFQVKTNVLKHHGKTQCSFVYLVWNVAHVESQSSTTFF
jgi:hypothetical protein